LSHVRQKYNFNGAGSFGFFFRCAGFCGASLGAAVGGVTPTRTTFGVRSDCFTVT
jgi:hypothetical protein